MYIEMMIGDESRMLQMTGMKTINEYSYKKPFDFILE
jgi:hypothetical protein